MDVPRTLLGLPTELWLNIFHWVFRAVVFKVERADYPIPEPPEARLSPVPTTPSKVTDIKLVCRTFAQEIGYSWHSTVTYSFPSTVAFLDVLSQWSPEQNIWLDPSGDPQDDHALLHVTYRSILGLSTAKGWRRLHYVSGILGLTPREQHEVETAVEAFKSERGDTDLRYGFGRVRPQAREIDDEEDTITRPADDAEVEEVLKWYDDHPEEGHPLDFPDVSEKHVSFWIRRGKDSNYTQDGLAKEAWIEGLLELPNTNWCEFRRTRGLEHDAVDDPWAYL